MASGLRTSRDAPDVRILISNKEMHQRVKAPLAHKPSALDGELSAERRLKGEAEIARDVISAKHA